MRHDGPYKLVIKGSVKDRPATGQMLSIRGQDKYRVVAATRKPNIRNLKFIFWPTTVTECACYGHYRKKEFSNMNSQ
jgi:hypothetical protein